MSDATEVFHRAQMAGLIITEMGELPGDKDYRGTCVKCGTKVKFKRDAARYNDDHRDGDYLSVECPLCRNQITAAV